MDKSPEAFRTISEVAEHLETPAHVLRFWESRFPQIRPVKRAGGRRYYRPSDVSLLTGIKRLLHDEGMTIRGVQKILREQGVRHVAGLSGDVTSDEFSAQTPYVDQVEDAVLATVATLPIKSQTPGLTEAMAKAVDQKPLIEGVRTPSATEPTLEPLQGALLLTPVPVGATDDLQTSAGHEEADQVGGDALNTSQADAKAVAERPAPDPQGDAFDPATAEDAKILDPDRQQKVTAAAQPVERTANAPFATPDVEQDSADFDVDDFDNGPVTTLASRIRSLPPEASAAPVGAQLLSVVERLQMLRDRMADAARSGRS